MTIANGKELRQAYLDYFRGLDHRIVPSAPLVPPDDPTLLFTSAGMVQFKALYSGTVDPMPYVRAASCQKCLRAGGKGSDLENVGKTLRHHTFFEMLGNFSFGDYFKREAIRWAWEFCTSPKYMNLPKDRMFPTIFGPTEAELDVEALQYYKDETDCPNPCIPLDAAENFWGPAGDTGACGPCSEIKFFLGSDEELKAIHADLNANGSAAIKRLGQRVVDEGDLFLEIWNMVFPQYDQQRDGSRPLLKNKGIDTGAGLERMTVALHFARTGKASSPYETDLMWPITQAVANKLNVSYPRAEEINGDAKIRLAVNAIADHVRTLVFCLAEGLTPGNIGRRYVVRRIQRRALRFASLLGMDKPFMADLYDSVVEAMGDQYPEIKQNPEFIKKSLRIEEETFLRTRDRGEKIINELIAQAKDRGDNRIAGPDAFKLWDTYGYPVDLTIEVALDAGVAVDMEGYASAVKGQKEEAKKSWKGAKLDFNEELVDLV
ncbi:MAG: alanine--tRNA ligase-related protein, partial [Candidatus Sumerlaeota bacterium]